MCLLSLSLGGMCTFLMSGNISLKGFHIFSCISLHFPNYETQIHNQDSRISDYSRFWISCLYPFGFMLPKYLSILVSNLLILGVPDESYSRNARYTLNLISTNSKCGLSIWFVQHNQGTPLSMELYLVEEFVLYWWRDPDYTAILQLTNALYHTSVGCMLCLYPMGCIAFRNIQSDISHHTLL
jgi:hypothetical protein